MDVAASEGCPLIASRVELPMHEGIAKALHFPDRLARGTPRKPSIRGATVDTLIATRRDVPFRSAAACRAALSLRAVSRMMGRRRVTEAGRGERQGLRPVFGMAFCGPPRRRRAAPRRPGPFPACLMKREGVGDVRQEKRFRIDHQIVGGTGHRRLSGAHGQRGGHGCRGVGQVRLGPDHFLRGAPRHRGLHHAGHRPLGTERQQDAADGRGHRLPFVRRRGGVLGGFRLRHHPAPVRAHGSERAASIFRSRPLCWTSRRSCPS